MLDEVVTHLLWQGIQIVVGMFGSLQPQGVSKEEGITDVDVLRPSWTG